MKNLIRYDKDLNGGVNLNKLQRSKKDRVLFGVCGGIGEYFNIDPTIVRIVFVFLGYNNFGTTLLVYLLSSFIIPEDDGVVYSDDYYKHNEKNNRNIPFFLGGGLIIWGGILLTRIIFPWFTLRLMHLWNYWPVSLILLGIYIIFNQRKK